MVRKLKRPKSTLSAGEVRFRTSDRDIERLEWLLNNHPDEHRTVSALLRTLISNEYTRLCDSPIYNTKGK